MSAAPAQHLLSLLRSDVEALVARSASLQYGERQVALELLLTAAWYLSRGPDGKRLELEGNRLVRR